MITAAAGDRGGESVVGSAPGKLPAARFPVGRLSPIRYGGAILLCWMPTGKGRVLPGAGSKEVP
jgi:hypothetical protein